MPHLLEGQLSLRNMSKGFSREDVSTGTSLKSVGQTERGVHFRPPLHHGNSRVPFDHELAIAKRSGPIPRCGCHTNAVVAAGGKFNRNHCPLAWSNRRGVRPGRCDLVGVDIIDRNVCIDDAGHHGRIPSVVHASIVPNESNHSSYTGCIGFDGGTGIDAAMGGHTPPASSAQRPTG